ncbi:S-adenosyl-L-methionine-dependent methyltransferase [Calocera viscosa TUFC12733]|uniref:Cytosine-specific methyltransferase n=1 Tax=Calocera viscosa (strain TUFC12733) TaxID=1330018 RepID=A0A167R1C4_CALVF|nr:S-adenosyl-L-methionine-dependent methyltransferase [Calocera viscosa TUFC12733]
MTTSRKRRLSDDSQVHFRVGIRDIRGTSVVSNLSTSLAGLSVEPDPPPSLQGDAEYSRRAHKRSKTNRFILPKDCVTESEDLVLDGEEADEPDGQADEDSSLPIRRLDDFVIFDEANQGEMSPLSSLEEPDTDLRVYGIIKPMFVGEEGYADSDDESDPAGVEERLEFASTAIFLYYLEPNPLNPLVWLKTQYSWLVLDRPALEYRAHYYGFWETRYLCRLALLSTRVALEHFDIELSEIPQTESGGAVNLCGKIFSQQKVLRAIPGNEDVVQDILLDAVEGGWENAGAVISQLYPRKGRAGFSKQRSKHHNFDLSGTRVRSHPRTAGAGQHFRPFFTPSVEKLASLLGLLGPAHGAASTALDKSNERSLLERLEDSIENAANGEQDGVWGLDDASDGDRVPLSAPSYHPFDFAYFRGKKRQEGSQPFRVGQIREFRGSEQGQRVIVQLFDRFDNLNGLLDEDFQEPKDSCHLYASRVLYTMPTAELRGRCVVRHYEELQHDARNLYPRNDEFYVKYLCRAEGLTGALTKDSFVLLQPSDLTQCTDAQCKETRSSWNEVPTEPLSCLELFHGAGALSLGLEQAGCITTKWAIDANPNAHMTLRANFPDVAAILQDTNAALRRAIDLAEGRHPPPLFQMGSRSVQCPELPRRGEVEIIIGGPPCQGFSRLNSFATATDIRNSLVGNALSYVDFYKPRFVLLENVEALLNMHSTVREDGEEDVKHVENAFAKLIVCFLVERGYQVRFKVLQAAQYGAPQMRNRIIFLAALKGETLPDFPLPTHTWRSRTSRARDLDGGAPHPYVTVEDAISDLPPFHWDWDERGLRRPDPDLPRPQELRVPALTKNRKRETCGYTDATEYPGPPKTAYQRSIRHACQEIEYHVTTTQGVKCTEIVCNIPPPQPELGIPEGLDWRALCMALAPPEVAHPHGRLVGDTNINADAKYARVYACRPAQTVVTTISAGGRMTRILHYSQYRLLTARENARLQGFPDTFKFVSRKNDLLDIYRLIGNAVPVPLVYQLGLELNKALTRKGLDGAGAIQEREESLEL